jgi:hypothetical protein
MRAHTARLRHSAYQHISSPYTCSTLCIVVHDTTDMPPVPAATMNSRSSSSSIIISSSSSVTTSSSIGVAHELAAAAAPPANVQQRSSSSSGIGVSAGTPTTIDIYNSSLHSAYSTSAVYDSSNNSSYSAHSDSPPPPPPPIVVTVYTGHMQALQIAPMPVHISGMPWDQFMHGCRNFLRASEHCEINVLHHYNGGILQVQTVSG